MDKRIIIIGFLFFILVVPSLAMAIDTLPGTYKAGDTLDFKYPPNGPSVSIGTEPKFVRWTLFDPDGNNVYEEDHAVTFKEQLVILGPWIWYDEYELHIPGFAKPGTWKISGRLYSSALMFIQVPDLFPYERQFTVKESSTWESLTAPFYWTWDLGFFGGRYSLSLPVHPILIGIIILIGIALLIMMIKIYRNFAVPKN